MFRKWSGPEFSHLLVDGVLKMDIVEALASEFASCVAHLEYKLSAVFLVRQYGILLLLYVHPPHELPETLWPCTT